MYVPGVKVKKFSNTVDKDPYTYMLSEKITSGSTAANCEINPNQKETRHLREHKTCPRMQIT